MEKTDEQLIEEIKRGEIFAFEILVKRYQQKLFWFVHKITQNQQNSEEIVQDTFFNLYKSMERLDLKQKFSSYLYASAKNTAFSFLRKTKKEIRLNDELLTTADDDLYQRLAQKQDTQKIKKIIKNLPQKYHQAVRLYYFNDLSYEEIGKKLSLPKNTVRTHLRRAKLLLRQNLKDEKS